MARLTQQTGGWPLRAVFAAVYSVCVYMHGSIICRGMDTPVYQCYTRYGRIVWCALAVGDQF